MTITEQDYRRVIGEQQLRIVTQADEDIRRGAEVAAQQEMAGYLASRYNTTAIFSAEGEERNPIIVMYLCDIALYHLSAALPQRLGSEVRKERYDRAIRWLEGVQKGLIVPDLPTTLTDEEGNTTTPPPTIIYNSEPKLQNNW